MLDRLSQLVCYRYSLPGHREASVLALKLTHERHYWKFVVGAVIVGIVFSGITYWQQVRMARQATVDRMNAIAETSDRIAKEVSNKNAQQNTALRNQISDLRTEINDEKKHIGRIEGSNIVTGKKRSPFALKSPTLLLPLARLKSSPI
jgi:hypothetical protein